MHTRRRTISRRRRDGFTLTELLVVIGIIVALAAIGLPMALRSYKAASRTRTQADLQSIATALNAYKQDFGDYPRVSNRAPGQTVGPGWNVGPAILCKALIGPYGDGIASPGNPDPQDPPPGSSFSDPTTIKSGQCISDNGAIPPGVVALIDDPGPNYADTDKWAPFGANDGADGPGFRLRQLPGQAPQGKVHGPYLQAEKFNVIGCMFHDREGNPILYFPARLGNSNIRAVLSGEGGFVHKGHHALYDARDGIIFFRRPVTESDDTNALIAMRIMLGDFNANPALINGIIDPGETPATDAPFLLWSAGPDGLFGPIRPDPTGSWTPTKREIEKCDDITNFIP